jgi:phage shock protein E
VAFEWVLIAVAVLVLAAVVWARKSFASPGEAKKLVEQGALLLDVRTQREFAAGHIPGAMNIPIDGLSARIAEVGSKDRRVIAYCASGVRSARAVKILRDAGFKDPLNLGGMNRWPS